MKYYAIKRPDGSWIMARPHAEPRGAWTMAAQEEGHLFDTIGTCSCFVREASACRQGYTCVEVSGFVEVKP